MRLTCLVGFNQGPVYTLYREKLSLEAFAHYYEKKDDPLPKPRTKTALMHGLIVWPLTS